MIDSAITLIAKYCPTFLLPSGERLIVDAQGTRREPLSLQDRRQRAVDTLRFRLDRLRRGYWPPYLIKKKFISYKNKKTLVNLHKYIGEIALIHAGIEQQMKTIMFQYFSRYQTDRIEPKLYGEKLYGSRLLQRFIEFIKSEFKEEKTINERAQAFFESFGQISRKRNEFVKTLYALGNETNEIFIVNARFHIIDTRNETGKFGIITKIRMFEILEVLQVLRADREKLFYLDNDIFTASINRFVSQPYAAPAN